MYDVDSTSQQLNCHDYLGNVIVTLGSVVGECGGKVTKHLVGKNNKPTSSTISFVAEELCNNKEMISMQFKARKLLKKLFIGHPDPFLVFSRQGIENEDFVTVHKTETIKNNSNPVWRCFNIPVTSLCNGDKHRPVKIECFDHNNDGSHNLIGDASMTVNETIQEGNFSKQIIHPRKRKKKKYSNSGWLDLVSVQLKQEASFLEYIFGGVDLNVHVAIDFTASNGNPLQPSSLHFINRHTPNKYVEALTAIGTIIQDYDTDKIIPAYGFGAKINGQVYHDFHLNQKDDPHCSGIHGVIQAYERVIPTVELYGPTNFAPIINLVTKAACGERSKKKYHILLILTDGAITDMEQTKRAIIKASFFPISIIIVGIGIADFSLMDELDSDKGMLTCEGETAERDIVQFVPFHKFSGHFAAEDLAKEVLFEVPNQLVEHMTRYNVKPQPTCYPFASSHHSQRSSFPSHDPVKKPLVHQTSLPSPPRQGQENEGGHLYYERHSMYKTNARDSTISAKEYALQTLAQYNDA